MHDKLILAHRPMPWQPSKEKNFHPKKDFTLDCLCTSAVRDKEKWSLFVECDNIGTVPW